MRIAFFTRCLPAHGLGGMEIHADQVARGLAARGHEVVLYTTRLVTGHADRSEGGVRIRHLAGTRPRSYVGGYWRVSRRAFMRDHATRPFDVVYSESSGAFGLLRDAPPIVPVVVFLVGTPAADLRSKLRQGIHRPRIWAGIAWNLFGHIQSRRYLPRAVRILCESDGLREWVLRELPLDPARVSVAWLGTDTDRFSRQGPSWARSGISPRIAPASFSGAASSARRDSTWPSARSSRSSRRARMSPRSWSARAGRWTACSAWPPRSRRRAGSTDSPRSRTNASPRCTARPPST